MATKKTMSRHKARMKALHDVTSGLLGSDSKPKPVKSGTSPSEDSAGIKKFRKDLAAKRKFAAEMGTIRNTVGLQPGAKEGVTGAKFDQKQYSNPPRKVKIDPVQNRRQKRRRQRQ